MSRTEEILAEILAEEEREKASRAGAPQAFITPRYIEDGLTAFDSDHLAILDIALDASAVNAVLRRRVADLTSRLEELEGRRP